MSCAPCGSGVSLHPDMTENPFFIVFFHQIQVSQNKRVNVLFVCLTSVEGRQTVNGHSSRLLHSRRNRNHRAPRRAPTQSCDREQENTARCSLKRRTAQAAVNKMKLLEASLSEEDCEEENPRRSSRRPPVIQSSSESEGPSAHGTKPSTASFNIIIEC